jgi:uncharacterized membrane protein YhfC
MDLLTVTHFLNSFLMIAVPILLGIYLISRFRLGWRYWWIGGFTFILSQVLHLPFNSYVLNPVFSRVQQSLPGVGGTLLIASLLGLSAGIFETGARYAMYRWWLKDFRTWRVSVLAGAGHGGMEAIILGALVFLAFFNMMAYRNLDLSNLNLSPEQLEVARLQIQSYWSLPWYETMLGALERIFTIPFHIAMFVLVLQVFTRKPGRQQLGWLGLAALFHALMDASAVFVANQYSPYLAEVTIGAMAVLAVFIIFRLREPELETPLLPHAPVPPPTSFTPHPVEESSDNLEKTRYQ